MKLPYTCNFIAKSARPERTGNAPPPGNRDTPPATGAPNRKTPPGRGLSVGGL